MADAYLQRKADEMLEALDTYTDDDIEKALEAVLDLKRVPNSLGGPQDWHAGYEQALFDMMEAIADVKGIEL